jgi:RimJ/RimL family protein N-acetyltransferase
MGEVNLMGITLEIPASAISCTLEKPLSRDAKVIIRPLALTDAPNIVEAIDESLTELKQFMPWAHYPQTIESQRIRIVTSIHDYWSGRDNVFGIFGATTNSFLGCSGLHRRTLNSRGLEIGYWIRSSIAGKGLTTAVTRSLIVYGFEYLGLNRIQCCHNAKNIGSARVNDKCNLKIEGTLKNFESQATDEMIQNGWLGSNEIVIRGLCPEDVPNLHWYDEVRSRITVFDWLGQSAVS